MGYPTIRSTGTWTGLEQRRDDQRPIFPTSPVGPLTPVNRPGNVRTSIGYLRPETFDVLAIVYFAEDMRSVQAWTAPAELVPDYAQRYDADRRAYRLTLTKRLLRDPRVEQLGLELPGAPSDAE